MNLPDFISLIRGYTGRQDTDVLTDGMIESFVRQAEERISSELRIKDMVQIDTALISAVRVQLPPDWRAADYVRIVGYGSLDYMSRADFYDASDNGLAGYYTTSGTFMMFGGSPNTVEGKTVELHYFGDVPPLTATEASSWVAEKHQTLLIPATIATANELLEETDIDWNGKYNARLDALNDEYARARTAGSRLARRGRSFG